MSAYRGVRIADFSQGLAGPMAAMLLGDLEAEVVKIEPPGGDRLKDHPGYLAWNRNKQVVTLDLQTPEGLVAAKALIAGADVALFDWAPGRLEALGLDAASLTAAQPALIHAWMPPYGTTGEWSDLPPHHSLLAGLTGMAFRQGVWSDQPVHLVLPIAWYAQAVVGSGAIGAALYERSRSGLGQGLTISGLHGSAQASPLLPMLSEPAAPRPTPPGINPSYRLYQCADGQWFFLGTLFENFYRKALEVMGLGDLVEALAEDMVAARDLLEGMFISRPRDEWLAELHAAGVPCAAVGSREAWFAGEVVAASALRAVLAHPSLGDVAMPAPSTKLSANPASIRALPAVVAAPPAWPARSLASGATSAGGPLAGVKVLNLGTVIAGSYTGTMLAQLGADVVKIEPRDGDPFRPAGSTYLAFNRGPRGLGLDLKQAEGRNLFLELVRSADIVIDNYRLGVRSRLGIDYSVLKALNPRIISCSINAYGETGPRAAMPGFDPLMQAEGGMMAAQGGDSDPILITIPVNDIATAGAVVGAITAALNVRERTGEGQEILTSLLAQSLLFQSGELVTYDGRPPNDLGGTDCLGTRALHRYYACADGWIGLVAETASQAMGVGRVLAIDMGDAPLAASRDGELAARIEAALAGRGRAETLAALRREDVAAAPVLRELEARDDRWLADNDFLERWDDATFGPMIGPVALSTFSRTPTGFAYPAPRVGEHSAEILGAYGISPGRIAGLMAAGAVF